MDRQRGGAELPHNAGPVFFPNTAGNLEFELHLVYLAQWVRVGNDCSPLELLFRYGDLDRGSDVAANKGDLDARVLFSCLLQVKLHETVMC